MREAWVDLVTSYMRLRGLNQSGLAEEWNVSNQVVSNWMTRGTRPNLQNIVRIHERSGLPLAQLLEAAEYLTMGVPAAGAYPGWAHEVLRQLNAAELAVVVETARGLLRMRGVNADGTVPVPDPSPGKPRRGRPPKVPRS